MQYKTPGVYVEEISLFPPSVASVETAVPAFIGYTEKAEDSDGQSLSNVPTKIDSLIEFEQYFGGDYDPSSYDVSLTNFSVTNVAVLKRYLYKNLQLYFGNGGGACYIVSIGAHADDLAYSAFKTGLDSLLKYDEPTLILFPDAVGVNDDDSTLTDTEIGTLQADTLAQCAKLQDRFGVFDILGGFADGTTETDAFRQRIGINNLKYGAAYHPFLDTSLPVDIPLRLILESSNPITDFDVSGLNPTTAQSALLSSMQDAITRTNSVSLTNVSYGHMTSLKSRFNSLVKSTRTTTTDGDQAPFFDAAINILRQAVLGFQAVLGDAGLGSEMVQKITTLSTDTDLALADEIVSLLEIELNATLTATVEVTPDVATFYASLDSTTWLNGDAIGTLTADATLDLSVSADVVAERVDFLNYILSNVEVEKLLDAYQGVFDTALLQEGVAQTQLTSGFVFFDGVKKAVEKEMRRIPPSGAIVGVYAKTDATRGVWKAPANVALSNVISPSVKLTNTDQDGLNVDTTSGKSINAIRSFTGKGTLIWGARTLAGNDNEWRYVSVRRFFNMVEESVKKATGQFVFEPNDANTWVKIRSMISNYLTTLWRQGALAGPTPSSAFFVNVGLGVTMTPQDILEGRMIVEIGMAAVRPAEFIILRFSHKLQEA